MREISNNNLIEITREGGIVSRVLDGERRYQAWPTVCVDERGTLYTVYSGERLSHVDPFGVTCMCKSLDGGVSWEKPTVINDSGQYLDYRDAGLVYLGDGRLLNTYFKLSVSYYTDTDIKWQTRLDESAKQAIFDIWNTMDEKSKRGGSAVVVSEDFGKTWSEPIAVPVSSPHGPTVIKKDIKLPDGSVLKKGDILYVGKATYPENYNAAEYKDNVAYAICSHDGGKSWEKLHTFENPRREEDGIELILREPHSVQLADGDVLTAFRVHNGHDMRLTVYTARLDSSSGKWSEPQPTGFVGSPPHLLELEGGSVLMTYSRRDRPCGIRGRLSDDGGATWGEEFILSSTADPADRDLGYPATVQLPDKSLLTVFYQHYKNDTYPSILYTKWKVK